MSFKAVLEADIKGFSNNIDKAIGSVDKLEKTTLQKLSKVGDSFVKVGGVMSAFSAVVGAASIGLVKMGISAGDASADINNLSTATSLSTDLIQELSYVATASNSSFEGLQSSMDSFQRRLKTVGEEGSRVNEMFGRLGISTTDASGNVRSMDDVLLDTFNRLGDMEEGLAKNAIGAELFGRSWNEVALIVSSGSKGIAELRKEANKLGLVLDENILQSSDDFSTAMGLVGFQLDTLKTKIGASLVPILEGTLLPLLEEKIIPAVSRFADNIAELSEKFNALSPSTKNTIFAITGIATAIGPLLLGLGGLLKILPLIGAGFTAMTGPIGIAVTAIVAGATLIITHWDEIKTASNNVVEYIKDDWNRLKESLAVTSSSISKLMKADFRGWWEDVKKSFDLSIDYITNRWKQFKGIFEEPLSAQAGVAIGGIGQALKNISEEEPEATTSLSNFSDAVKEVAELDTFQKLIGEQLNVRDAVSKTVSTIEDLQSKLVKLQLGILPSTNVRQELAETQQQINDLSTALDLLTGGRELNIKVNTNISGLEAAENKFLKDGAIVVPPIDTSLLENSLGQAKEMVAISAEQMGSLLSTGISMFAQTIGDAFAGNWDGLGAGLLKAVGSLAQQFGGLIVGMGVAALKLRSLIANPITAIAAGAALIALGAAASGAAQKMISSVTDGGGYSSAPSLRNTGPSYGASEYRGQYQDDFKVEFKIGTNELVGVLNTAEQRRNRL